jgi:hypothetical protein
MPEVAARLGIALRSKVQCGRRIAGVVSAMDPAAAEAQSGFSGSQRCLVVR